MIYTKRMKTIGESDTIVFEDTVKTAAWITTTTMTIIPAKKTFPTKSPRINNPTATIILVLSIIIAVVSVNMLPSAAESDADYAPTTTAAVVAVAFRPTTTTFYAVVVADIIIIPAKRKKRVRMNP